MHLIVGLGNPGDKYRNNRHNIGFMAARRHRAPPRLSRVPREVPGPASPKARIDGEKVLILKPQTFMNRSGDSIQQVGQVLQARRRRRHRPLRRDRPRPRQGPRQASAAAMAATTACARSIRRSAPTTAASGSASAIPGHKDLVMPHVLGDFAKADRRMARARCSTPSPTMPAC